MAKNKNNKIKVQQEPSTQQHIPFGEIRDNVIIMKDGTLRTVILVSSLNFALKSEDEQKGIVQGYVSFLNSVDFELQIVIQSRRLNIEKYLAKLDTLAKQQDNELLRKQTKSYRVFIERLVEQADIMDKKFYVVIPFSPFSDKRRSFWARLREVLSPASVVKIEEVQFQEYKVELMRRVGLVTSGLRSIGLQTNTLDTQALIELFYNTYNPLSTQQKRIQDLDAIRVDRSYI
ncbi:MAG: hypothetical protein KIH62_001360 [Candidatus Kerfeldbacteria bacterium]|nr:hypothetical protein [Candidatus Kerfeldbacteria bacterium]